MGSGVMIIVFSAIGAGLKFIDDAFDEGVFSKRSAVLLAPVLVAVWITVSVLDAISATILFAVLAGVLLVGKIDNAIFKISAISIVLAAPLSGKISILWPPFLALTMAGIMDEIGNNYVDNNRSHRAVEFFFLHRFVMKIGVFSLCAISIFPWIYLLAFMAFDMSYDITGIFGQWMMDANAAEKLTLNGVRNKDLTLRIFTTAVLLCNEVPMGSSDWTFYFPEKKVRFTSILSSMALE
ncbi:MAG: hypothetical protein ACE5G7_03675 [Candidatus Hydrothermarchaeaceae archaeon]